MVATLLRIDAMTLSTPKDRGGVEGVLFRALRRRVIKGFVVAFDALANR
jgi:hypothetical protein